LQLELESLDLTNAPSVSASSLLLLLQYAVLFHGSRETHVDYDGEQFVGSIAKCNWALILETFCWRLLGEKCDVHVFPLLWEFAIHQCSVYDCSQMFDHVSRQYSEYFIWDSVWTTRSTERKVSHDVKEV
jgi:hypothetical protein